MQIGRIGSSIGTVNRIKGNENTKRLINNIVTNLQKEKPSTSHVDYSLMSISRKSAHSELLTDENNGVLRNVSILYVKGRKIQAAIWNKTGDIQINYKPWFMSIKSAVSKISKFLEDLQPENLVNAKAKPSLNIKHPDYAIKTEQLIVNPKQKIQKKIVGSNCTATREIRSEYKEQQLFS